MIIVVFCLFVFVLPSVSCSLILGYISMNFELETSNANALTYGGPCSQIIDNIPPSIYGQMKS